MSVHGGPPLCITQLLDDVMVSFSARVQIHSAPMTTAPQKISYLLNLKRLVLCFVDNRTSGLTEVL